MFTLFLVQQSYKSSDRNTVVFLSSVPNLLEHPAQCFSHVWSMECVLAQIANVLCSIMIDKHQSFVLVY